jgi:hypothetical protein
MDPFRAAEISKDLIIFGKGRYLDAETIPLPLPGILVTRRIELKGNYIISEE